MNTYLDCIPCFLRQSLDAARNMTADTRVHEQILRDVLRVTAELDLERPPPLVGQLIHRRLRELTGVADPYQSAKRHSNRYALAALPELTSLVAGASDPLLAAVRCAVAANVIDLGVSPNLTEAEVRAALRDSADEPVHGDWEWFRKATTDAEDILYLADNAGELAIDRLLIQQLGPQRVTLAVRGAPVLNDATMADASEVGMHELVEVIDNGSDAPGTLLDDCSDSFRERFERAGLIIAKGQGNFEALSHVGRNIAFLLKVKCPVVSRHVGLPLGVHALLRSGRR